MCSAERFTDGTWVTVPVAAPGGGVLPKAGRRRGCTSDGKASTIQPNAAPGAGKSTGSPGRGGGLSGQPVAGTGPASASGPDRAAPGGSPGGGGGAQRHQASLSHPGGCRHTGSVGGGVVSGSLEARGGAEGSGHSRSPASLAGPAASGTPKLSGGAGELARTAGGGGSTGSGDTL